MGPCLVPPVGNPPGGCHDLQIGPPLGEGGSLAHCGLLTAAAEKAPPPPSGAPCYPLVPDPAVYLCTMNYGSSPGGEPVEGWPCIEE